MTDSVAPNRTELLAPARTLPHLRAALAHGADAVYVGHPGYALRSRGNGFDLETLAQGIDEAHRQGKKVYLTSNLLPHQDRVTAYLRDLDSILALGLDGLVLADPGLIEQVLNRMHGGRGPSVPIHLSVQANTTNHATVKFWQRMGVRRIILSRELNLDEIEAIRQACPDVELEVMVHGSLCIAYSGRCLLSGYFQRLEAQGQQLPSASHPGATTTGPTDRSVTADWDGPGAEWGHARLGDGFDLAQERQQAQQHALSSRAACGGTQRHPAADRVYLLEEADRPGQLMPIMEDEHGTYILNSTDLRAVEHVERLVRIGVDSLKIEGRTKSPYYVARTTQAYRQAVDDAVHHRPFNPALIGWLRDLAPRGYTSGFLERRPTADILQWDEAVAREPRVRYAGRVADVRRDGLHLALHTDLTAGDTLEFVQPTGPVRATVTACEPVSGPHHGPHTETHPTTQVVRTTLDRVVFITPGAFVARVDRAVV